MSYLSRHYLEDLPHDVLTIVASFNESVQQSQSSTIINRAYQTSLGLKWHANSRKPIFARYITPEILALPSTTEQFKRLCLNVIRAASTLAFTPAEIRKFKKSPHDMASVVIKMHFVEDINLMILFDVISAHLQGPTRQQYQAIIERLDEINNKDLNWRALHQETNQLRAWMKANPILLQTITTLNLSNKELRFVPLEIGLLTGLRELNISHNDLTYLPETIKHLQSLQVLNASQNQLITLPNSLCELTNLNELNLSYNELTDLPVLMGRLDVLTQLDLSYNNFTGWPESLDTLVALSFIDF